MTVIAVTPLLLADPAAAACDIVYIPELVGGVIVLQAHEVCSSDAPAPVGAIDLPPTDSGLDAICVATAMSIGRDPEEYCDVPTNGNPVITPAMVATALRVIALPANALQVQPPNGRTLVNFDTNFFTDAQPFDRTVTLLGQRVDLHIVPSEFGWHFGDGESLTSAEPGSPYPRLDITHRYLSKGDVAPSVDTTYTARFRVNGGPWRDVPGSVTIAGPAVALQVLTATPTLVGYN